MGCHGVLEYVYFWLGYLFQSETVLDESTMYIKGVMIIFSPMILMFMPAIIAIVLAIPIGCVMLLCGCCAEDGMIGGQLAQVNQLNGIMNGDVDGLINMAQGVAGEVLGGLQQPSEFSDFESQQTFDSNQTFGSEPWWDEYAQVWRYPDDEQ